MFWSPAFESSLSDCPYKTQPAQSMESTVSKFRMTLGALLLIVGFLCHVFAAQAIGGTTLAYRDHILGFVILTLVSGAIILLLGRRFWRGRPDISLLILGIVQTAI